MRLISLDTETTGSAPASGDRCVEVGLVEIIDGALTGRTYQTYLNPERPVAWQAQRVHGLTDRFLRDKPLLHEVAAELLDFIGDAPCVAHGARFDRDMLLYDFRHAGLSVPRLTFYDSLPLARAHVRAPNHKLDTLGRTLGLIDQDRGLHGALEDAEILARVICRIAEGRPDALQSWLRGANALSPLPKGWDGGLAPSHPFGVPRTITPAREAVRSPVPGQVPAPEATSALPGEEAAEADRVANLVRMALEGSPDLPLFADRLTGAGVLVRPVLNGEMALHGVRFSTPKASFTGGAMGLTGSALERSGVRYLHPDHANLVRDLVSAHDAVMENILELKSLYKAVPSGSPARPGREVGVEARARLHEMNLPHQSSRFGPRRVVGVSVSGGLRH
jgi:DNA polymerase-3 subunit epsilon